MAQTAVARGPMAVLLQTSAGQYVMLGIGAYALFPEKIHKLLEYSPSLLKLVGSDDSRSSNNSPAPIIIHTPSPTVIGGVGGGSKTWVGTITYAAAGAGACWGAYIVAVQILPDAVGQFLPVTRNIFDKTTQSLGKGILSCKKALEEKIAYLSGQQDELAKKQDENNKTVSHIKSELGEARIDLTMLQSSMNRCEDSLEKSEGLQHYTLRGVRLLVRCVAGMLPEHIETNDELARFIEEEERLHLLNSTSTPIKPSNSADVVPQAPATPIYTPSLSARLSLSSTRRSGSETLSAAKKALDMSATEGGNDNELRALLGH